LAFLSGSQIKAGQGKRKNAAFAETSASTISTKKKRVAKQNQLLICGPTNSGKTTLFYHLLTKEIRSTVTSMEVNETPT